MNIISTRSTIPPRCATARRSRWSFTSATRVHTKVVYIYDGADIDQQQYGNWTWPRTSSTNRATATKSNPKVWSMREIVNSEVRTISGIPLPKGRMRFYRKDSDGQAPSSPARTRSTTPPRTKRLRVYTGNAFDLTGERTSDVNYKYDYNGRTADESFTIKVRNHKKTAFETVYRIVEHLYRYQLDNSQELVIHSRQKRRAHDRVRRVRSRPTAKSKSTTRRTTPGERTRL